MLAARPPQPGLLRSEAAALVAAGCDGVDVHPLPAAGVPEGDDARGLRIHRALVESMGWDAVRAWLD
jgi:hypothetical protein